MKIVKNQKGLTLIEILAVLAILGILAAISAPAIMNTIENSKKDVMLDAAKQVAHAAGLYCVLENPTFSTYNLQKDYIKLKLDTLISAGYIDHVISPTNKITYSNNSYVQVYRYRDGTYRYFVQLINSKTGWNYFIGGVNGIPAVNDVSEYKRENVQFK